MVKITISMKNFSVKQLIIAPLLLCLCLAVRGQEEEMTAEKMLAIFNMKFEIAAPDATFTATEQGWEEEATRAKLVCSALPAPYERVLADFMEITMPDDIKLISKDTMSVGGLAGYLMVTEATPPADEPEQEHFYGIMYIRSWDKLSTLNINAVYPKSQHERLYKKMLATFATVRKKED